MAVAVCFLWHCPAGRPGLPLATTLPCGARTFLGDVRGACPASVDATAQPTRPSYLQCYVAMDVLDTAVLLGAGLAAGTVNAVAGGGSLVTFPTLVAIGLPPVPANVTNSIAVSPGYVASVYGSRTELAAMAARHGRARLYALVPTALCGMAVGCALLLLTPARAFEIVVPFLVLGAAVLLAFSDRVSEWVRRRQPGGRADRSSPSPVALHAIVAVASVYGGYFGAALGVILVATLAIVLEDSLARVSAVKNAISATVGLGTVVVFALFGPVDWTAVAVIAPSALVGGYLGARLVRRLPPRVLRIAIVVVGVAVAIVLGLRAF